MREPAGENMALTRSEVRQMIRDELASLGGHLLAEYGAPPDTTGGATAPPLATLGGYMLGTYGPDQGEQAP